MDFRLWLESEVVTLPIASIIMDKDELYGAVSNIARGHTSMTDGPVKVAVHPKGEYELVDGYHRMVMYMLQGHTQVSAKVELATWKLGYKKELSHLRFDFRPNLQYKGLEEFIELYLLKRI